MKQLFHVYKYRLGLDVKYKTNKEIILSKVSSYINSAEPNDVKRDILH